MARIVVAVLAFVVTSACAVAPPPVVVPDETPIRIEQAGINCRALWSDELGRDIDPTALDDCSRAVGTRVRTIEDYRAQIRESPEYASRQAAREHPPLLAREVFIRTYQGNMGSIKLPGCGLHLDNLFDPFLLWAWLSNRPCFDRMMQAHADRGDNVVSVTPTSGYHGQNESDVWHQPDVFAAFLQDIRRYRNVHGEPIRVHVFFAGDAHFPTMLDDRGAFSAATFTHWKRDVDGIAAAAVDRIDSTVVCWECRHVRDQVTVGGYVQMGRYLAQRFPDAVHAQHFVQGSSSASAYNDEPDDPYGGNELEFWRACRRENWCDVFLFQFNVDGTAYSWFDTHPPAADALAQGVDARGALDRWWHIVVRLGDDPWSERSRGSYTRRGWPPVPVIAYEHIYGHYWNQDPARLTEAFTVEFCKRALAIGGWGCGSASYRRPQ